MKTILSHSFPPKLSNIWTEEFALQLAATKGAVSGLNQVVPLLHNPNLLMRPILDKEAESSSRLEGTQASIEDVYKSEIESDSLKSGDTYEIINYQKAMARGLNLVHRRTLNQASIRQIHKTLLANVRGQDKSPGQYRAGDVWIGADGTEKGEARYVPPDALHVPQLMEKLEDFIINSQLHPLIASGVIHHRFEAIHPFSDGNGRTGRILITLYLISKKELTMPILYPSGYFDKNKAAYMNALHKVDTNEDWYVWLLYYLKALQTQADQALSIARNIDKLYKSFRLKIKDEKAHIGLVTLLEYCFTQPYLSVPLAAKRLSIHKETIRRYIAKFEEKEILQYEDIIDREKVYSNQKLLEILRAI